MDSFIPQLEAITGIAENDLRILIAKAPLSYRHYKIKKKTIGYRTIYHPSKQTKLLQYSLIHALDKYLVCHECAYAYRPGLKSPLRKNAERHCKQSYFLRVDIKEFFPSISPDALFQRLTDSAAPGHLALTEDDMQIMRSVFFVKAPNQKLGLPIGAPSSPAISNAVMYPLDVALTKMATDKDIVYTRYADDLVFSCNTKGLSQAIVDGVELCLSEADYPKLVINTAKTHSSSRNSRRIVTGLFISPNGEIGIGHKNKRMIRVMLYQFHKNKLNEEDRLKLQGWLAFILDSEPSYFNSLCLRYSSELVKKALKRAQ